MNFNSITEVEAELAKHIPLVMQITGKDITLDRMKPLIGALGDPQNKIKIIHIAGTSGKTSTAYYIASLLKQSGKKVGLTVSPHVDSVRERIQLNLSPISEQDFIESFDLFMDLVNSARIEPTYFELLVAFAIWYFVQEKVDYAVLETGLGGLQDATNISNREDKICVITDIGIDHTRILGNTKKEIAAQKAGIVHEGNHLLAYDQSEEVTQVFKEACEKAKATLHIVQETKLQNTSLPLFQQRNWQLAKVVYDFLAKRDGLVELSEEQLQKSQQTIVPARMETVKLQDKIIILDGSHNGQKIGALVESIQDKYPNEKLASLISFVESEEHRVIEGLQELAKLKPHLIITNFTNQQDTPKKSVEPEVIKEAADSINLSSEIIEGPEKALDELLKRSENILLITGSFYLLNHIRPNIIKT